MALPRIINRIKSIYNAFSGSNMDTNPPTVGVLSVTNGGTGANSQAQARANLGIVEATTTNPGISRAATLEETLGTIN